MSLLAFKRLLSTFAFKRLLCFLAQVDGVVQSVIQSYKTLKIISQPSRLLFTKEQPSMPPVLSPLF